MRICSWKEGRLENESNQTVILAANSGLRNRWTLRGGTDQSVGDKSRLGLTPAQLSPACGLSTDREYPETGFESSKPTSGQFRQGFVPTDVSSGLLETRSASQIVCGDSSVNVATAWDSYCGNGLWPPDAAAHARSLYQTVTKPHHVRQPSLRPTLGDATMPPRFYSWISQVGWHFFRPTES